VGVVTSALEAKLLQSDPAVDSVSIVSQPILEWTPILDTVESPSFNFGTSLIKPYPYNETNGLEDFKPSFVSTEITLDGVAVTLQDDGAGEIVAITSSTNVKDVFRKKLGTVDYTRGIVSLKDIQVQSFVGNAICIIGHTEDADVTGTKDRIVRIRQQDVTVNIKASR
jgi:hypothetical protein